MALRGKTAEEQIYNFLIGKGMTPAGAAGLMGNLYAESGLKPTNIQNSYEKKLGFTDETYTAAVDSGAYGNFVNDSAGYGLAQWTYWSRKKALLEFVKARGASVGDLETQLEFLLHELNAGYAAVLSVLKTTGSVRAASDAVLLKFERPADQSTAAQERRAGYGQTYYNKYAAGAEKGQGTMTAKEKQNRANIVAIAESFFGCKESDGSHKKIIDIYNADKPLARGYPMKYTDAWCACFVSVVSIRGGALAVMPKEVGCGKMIELYQKLGRWQENDAYVPAPGDVVFYDWNDGPNYAATDNTAAPDHVGIVVSVTGSTIKVIEGNMSNAVGYRSLAVNGRYIRGFGLPDFSAVTVKAPAGTATRPAEPPATSTGSNDTQGAGMPVVGDVVHFTGAAHYASANANSGPACKPGTAKVTQLALGAKHPVHLIAQSGGGSTVYGWVDLADIQGATFAGTAPAPKMRVGARVKYSGPLYRDSNGNGQGKAVNGTYTIKYYYPGRKCGVHIDGLGWVPESACSVVG